VSPFVHQVVGVPITLVFFVPGLVAALYGLGRAGFPKGGPAPDPWQLGGLAIGLVAGWVASLPAQFLYDRLVPARCPDCTQRAAYRAWPSLLTYQCRACGRVVRTTGRNPTRPP
jgi:hypothetical protein